MHSRVASALLLALAIAFAHAASAADMPTKVPVAIPYAWTGLYLGVQGGGGWGRAEQSDATPFTSGRYDIDGGLIDGTLGYNWQAASIVYGVETDLAYAWIGGSTPGTDPASGPCGGPAGLVTGPFCEAEIKALGTLRGRIGVSWHNVLPYLAGGLAYARIEGAEGGTTGVTVTGSGAKWVAGWTIGAGLEALVFPSWSVKAEYLYADLGKHHVFMNAILGTGLVPQEIDTTAHIIRVGLNYHFRGP